MLDWKKYRDQYRDMTPTERAIIRRLFDEYIGGNSRYSEFGADEFAIAKDAFVAGYIIVLTILDRVDIDI
jgi:hypothetical protein